MSEIVRVKIKNNLKPSGLIAIPLWVWDHMKGMEVTAVKTFKPRNLATGKGKSDDKVEVYEFQKKDFCDALIEKNSESGYWFKHKSVYSSSNSDSFFFESHYCKEI